MRNTRLRYVFFRIYSFKITGYPSVCHPLAVSKSLSGVGWSCRSQLFLQTLVRFAYMHVMTARVQGLKCMRRRAPAAPSLANRTKTERRSASFSHIFSARLGVENSTHCVPEPPRANSSIRDLFRMSLSRPRHARFST